MFVTLRLVKTKTKKLKCNLFYALLRRKSSLRTNIACPSHSVGSDFLLSFFIVFPVKVIHVIALFCIQATTTSSFYRQYQKVRVDRRKWRAANAGEEGEKRGRKKNVEN